MGGVGRAVRQVAASMGIQLDGLERHGELVDGVGRYSMAVRAELLATSAASIDRYLRPAKATDQIRGVSTKPSPLLRSSITIGKAGDEVEAEPGFFEGDTVADCGPTLKGEFARTLNLTCVHTGWVFTRTMWNNANVHVLAALQAGVQEIPFTITGLDFDDGSEFLNKPVITWAGERYIYFTRSRPYKKNDQATIESKNNHLAASTASTTAATPARNATRSTGSGSSSTTGSTTSPRLRNPSAGERTRPVAASVCTTSRRRRWIVCCPPVRSPRLRQVS